MFKGHAFFIPLAVLVLMNLTASTSAVSNEQRVECIVKVINHRPGHLVADGDGKLALMALAVALEGLLAGGRLEERISISEVGSASVAAPVSIGTTSWMGCLFSWPRSHGPTHSSASRGSSKSILAGIKIPKTPIFMICGIIGNATDP